jgi:uncharacterized protein
MRISAELFVEWAMENPVNAALAARLPELRLPQCFLTAGCLYQAAWNKRSGREAGWGVKDYDVFYFDEDTSFEAEDAVIRRAQRLFADLDAAIEVKNQARVHLWYEKRFGGACLPLRSTRDGIDRYLITCTCVGIEAATGELYAPNGLQEIWDGVLAINSRNPRPDLFDAKALSLQARWPWLRIAG